MASSLYSNSQHVDFDSVLGMDDQAMVSMFQSLMDSGLTGFLGCPAVIYEDALVDFFENASVRDGVIISTVAGQLVEISEEWFAESFDLPVYGLGDLSAIPKDVIFDSRSIVSLSGEPISLSGGKNQMKIEFRLLCDIMAKAISVKAGSFNAITVEKFSLMTAIVCGVQMNWARILFSTFKKMVTPGTKQAKGFAVQISLLLENIPNLELGESFEFPASKILTDKTVHRFVSLNDKAGAEETTGAPKPKAASKKRRAADVGAAVTKKKRTTKKRVSLSKVNLDWMAVAQEAVPIQMIEDSTAPAADDTSDQPAAVDVFSADRPAEEIDRIERIDEQLTAEPAVEVSRISSDSPADQVDEEVPWFVRSFLRADRDNERLFEPEELTKEARTHGITWKKTCCSKMFEGSPRDRGVVIARSNTNTRSSCWIRTMLRVDGSWIIEPCADQWVKIPRKISSCEVQRQRQYDDTLPSVSDFFRVMKKRWADVCLEVTEFCASKRLLPVGSLQFCRSLSFVEPVFRVAPSQSPVFALRVSQFCSVFVDFSVFSWLPTTDITDFLSSIALNRTVFRSAQISQNTVSVAPSVQLSLDQRQSSSTSADSSSSLHFDTTDVDATVSSIPPVSLDFSAALADSQAILSEQINESQSGFSSRLHKIEQGLRDSLHEQAAVLKKLFQEACQEGRAIDDVQILRFNEFRKNI
ncbi:hypothetical protein F511_42314 [Dorcoceras hygrometricum]|uniref:Dystroglycan-like n=1 Tax=Dorcoceras hygrometricum TaxID=472368 RepID=A0A2Z7A850_9LAMI|nr:hypothetical protein F511_42314 [Dorcoceras hygrometricum]